MTASLKWFAAVAILFLPACAASQTSASKPKLHVASDGFPAGMDTPEGAATDLERAYIRHDADLFANVCIGLYQNHRGPVAYDNFMRDTISKLNRESTSKVHAPEDPRAVTKVFAARHFRREGPASYGYAAFDFRDVQFVDVQVALGNGKQEIRRILVIKTPDEKWHAHPAPKISPLLCFGIDEEKPSTADFSEPYEVQK